MILLTILDGWGINPSNKGNAVVEATTPVLDYLFHDYPHTIIETSGMAVGLPEGQMGNSEVGHLNIGAGRVVYQELTRITKSIVEGDFFTNIEFVRIMQQVKQKNGKLHLMGLVSDGGVHSHESHVYALLKMAKEQGLSDVFVHAFLDGRDTPPDSAINYIQQLQSEMATIGCGRIATLCGRYFAMDRDNRWDRVQKAYDALTLGMGTRIQDPVAALTSCYERKEFDEFVLPLIVAEHGQPLATVDDADGIIFFNFRPDRGRELTKAFVLPDFDGFSRAKIVNVPFVTFTQYEKGLPVHVAYAPDALTNVFAEYLSRLGKKQLHIAETEKYAHVTFFFNGGVEKQYPGEDRILIPSPKVATYDLQPEMSAFQVKDKVIEAIESKKYDFIVLNFANGDMVGHTGVLEAAVKAMEALDMCLKDIVAAVLAVEATLLITADHGNCEQMIDPQTGGPFTAHTTFPVPLLVVDKNVKLKLSGILADIIPTVIDIMGLQKPKEMTGVSLVLH